MNLRPCEVVLIRIDARDDDFVAAPVSRPGRSKFNLSLHQWGEAGLNVASTIRVHELTVLAKDQVVDRVGELAATDRLELAIAVPTDCGVTHDR
jgi:hypothetical protein